MVKTTGYEFKKFYDEPWPEGWTHVHETIVVNQMEFDLDNCDLIEDTDSVKIYDGVVYSDLHLTQEVCSFETYFKRWKKKQTTTTLVVELPNDYVNIFKTHLPQYKGKIV